MGFIGNIPAEKYISLSVQHFTVTATTSYTLDSGVTNENEIALFINNVRQEPGASYAYTATGTTLTLSVATAGTDSMYCLFLGKARETVTPALGSVTDAMLSGSISSAKITSLDAAKLTGSVPSSALTNVDLSQLEMNQALLAFKIASSNQLAKFSMVDQVIDEYQDATGIDAGNSTNELASGATTAKYYEGGSGATPTASGGTITTDGLYTIHSFTASGNYINNTAQSVEYLVIAGGGGGSGADYAGGGGAGGYRTATGLSVSAATHAITVGNGGAGGAGTGSLGAVGQNSSFASYITSSGGGGGAYQGGTPTAGGSGGGSANQASWAGGAGNAGGYTPVEGYAGGRGTVGYAGGGAGGGGGSSAVGITPAGAQVQGHGGAGTSSSITGSSVVRAGGGGGGGVGGTLGGDGGTGGGGRGGGTAGSPIAGTANTGSGGGGSDDASRGGVAGLAGGSGIVIIRRLTSTIALGADLTLQSVATTAESAPTTADLVVLIEDGAGTATVNTDIKGFVSRNGSAFSTEVTFVDEGDWGTNKRILVARNIDISGITTGTAMKYKLTSHNQSAGSKETRIHATSLAWA